MLDDAVGRVKQRESWEIGGRFHPAYSLLGAGMIALGRAARTIAGRGIALVVVAGVLGALGFLAVHFPAALPLVVAVVVVVWTTRRFQAWRTEEQERREIVNRPG